MKFAVAAFAFLASTEPAFGFAPSARVASNIQSQSKSLLVSASDDKPFFALKNAEEQSSAARVMEQAINSPQADPTLVVGEEEDGGGQDGEYVRKERIALDIAKTVYVRSIKQPKDAYVAFAEKGAANAKMSKTKILQRSVLGGMYVGFAGLLAMQIAGNLGGAPSGVGKMTFGSLFPVKLLLIVSTGGQLFTGNSSTVAAAKFEVLVTWREMWRSWTVSLFGNMIGCGGFALAAAAHAVKAAVGKTSAGFGPTLVEGILCNWMVSLALFLAEASNELAGKMVDMWFPISTFVGIGLEHSVANLFILPAGMLAEPPSPSGRSSPRTSCPSSSETPLPEPSERHFDGAPRSTKPGRSRKISKRR